MHGGLTTHRFIPSLGQVYGEFRRFVNDAIRDGKVRPEAVYAPQLAQLEKSLAASEQTASLQQLEVLREGLNAQVRRDLVKHQVRTLTVRGWFVGSFQEKGRRD